MQVVSQITEQKLAAAMRSESREVFSELYRVYAPLLLGYISRITIDEHAAEEALQKSFIEIWRYRSQFNPETERLFTWMLKITKKISIGFIPETRYQTNKKINHAITDDKEIAGDELKLQDKVLEMVHFNNYTLQEAACVLKTDEDQLRTLLRNAIGKLKHANG